MKNIVMGDNNPMNVQYFNYRIEFQARGAGHTHGVLWLDLEAVERDLEGNKIYHMNDQGISVPKLIFPGVKEAMIKIKMMKYLMIKTLRILSSLLIHLSL